jgi:hypothetical protein
MGVEALQVQLEQGPTLDHFSELWRAFIRAGEWEDARKLVEANDVLTLIGDALFPTLGGNQTVYSGALRLWFKEQGLGGVVFDAYMVVLEWWGLSHVVVHNPSMASEDGFNFSMLQVDWMHSALPILLSTGIVKMGIDGIVYPGPAAIPFPNSEEILAVAVAE